MNREALKARLLKIAQRESLKFGRDVSQEMKQNIKLEKNEGEKWVKIIYIGTEIKRKSIDRENFKVLLRQIVPEGELPTFEILEEEDHVKLQFDETEIANRVYNHYNGFFFGNLQAEVVNDYLTKYIKEMLEEGCATGACSHDHGADPSCEGGSCGYAPLDDSEEK